MENFKQKAHQELMSVLPKADCDIKAFLSAVGKVTGTIEFIKKRMNLCFSMDSYDTALIIIEMLKNQYPADFEISKEHSKNSQKKVDVFSVLVPKGFTKQVLIDLELMSADETSYFSFSNGLPQKLIKRLCCAKSYLQGLFLACGSVYVPSMNINDKKDGYHFEFQFEDEPMAFEVQHLLLNFDIASKINERGSYFLVYIKDKDEIMRLLEILGLGNSVLTLQSIINERETANSINRLAICESANLDKTFEASSKQMVAIKKIEDANAFDSLTPVLKVTAQTRKENPQSTLSELAEILDVSKSCLNHRLRKIVEIAKDFE